MSTKDQSVVTSRLLIAALSSGGFERLNQGSRNQQRRKPRRKLDADAVRAIRDEWEAASVPNRDELGKKYGVSITTIDSIVRRKTWKNVPNPEAHFG